MAKLERPEAVEHLDEILHACDAVMVARGDLGLELPLETVPRVQKEITRRARALGVPVIVATQVFESMMKEPRPTRAEVSDAANAVGDGVDAIMLAGETAAGAYPLKAVQTLDLVLRDAERIVAPPVPLEEAHVRAPHGQAMCEAAMTLADRGHASAIVAVTRGGKTAGLLSALRPGTPIVAATDQPAVARRLALSWGVLPLVTTLEGNLNELAERFGAVLVERGVVLRGQRDRAGEHDAGRERRALELPQAAVGVGARALPGPSPDLCYGTTTSCPRISPPGLVVEWMFT